MNLDHFNSTPAENMRPPLLACCDVPTWADAVLAGRPYRSADAILAAADAAARDFTASDVDRALAAHPRIGERASGQSTEAAWSRKEQSGVSTDAATQAALAEGNRAYEKRFDRVFLVNAAGLDAQAILARLTQRLGHDPATEARVVAGELRGIALRRLARLLDIEDEAPAAQAQRTSCEAPA